MVSRVGTNRPFDHNLILQSLFDFSSCGESGILMKLVGTSFIPNMNLKFIFKQNHSWLLPKSKS